MNQEIGVRNYEPWRHTRQKRSRDEPFHTVRRSNPHRNGCTHSAPPSTHRHAHRPASSAEQDSSEINERPSPSTGKPNRRFVFCKNGAEASLLEARHSNGRHSAQFEMHCLRFCVFSTRTGLALRDGTGLAAPTDVAVARALSHGVRCARTLHAVAVHTAHPGAVVGVRRLRCKTKSRKQPD